MDETRILDNGDVMVRFLGLGLLVAALVAVILLVSQPPKLAFTVDNAPGPSDRRFIADVHLGCGDGGEVKSIDVEYAPDSVAVTFRGNEGESDDDCLVTETYPVELEEPLGDRRLCDGSVDPPEVVQPEQSAERPRC